MKTADRDVKVVADAEQLKRVVYNIINNSVKYMDKPEGIIKTCINDEDAYVRVDMKTTAGIDKDELPFIFDRFYRRCIRGTKTGGSGLGLAIAKKVIEDHFEDMVVKERAKGQPSFTLKRHMILLVYQEENDEEDTYYRG